MDLVKTLSRSEMKDIIGGSGNCRIALRDSSTGAFVGYSGCVPEDEAVGDYQNQQSYTDGTYASGYCCESCASPQFENSPGMCY